nr:5'-nucleotidase C-terminal domain-containing protein [uncultured Dorea sp.]
MFFKIQFLQLEHKKTSVDYEAAQNYPKDASVTAVLDSIKAENETVLNRVIGTSPVELDGVWEQLETSLTIQKNCIVANDSGEWDAWPNDSGSYLQVGGITVRFDPAQPAGARVLSVKKDGQDLDDTAVAQ